MPDNFTAGVSVRPMWHNRNAIEALPDAETMIRRAEELDAWPHTVVLEDMTTATGLVVPGSAVVAEYHSGERRAMAAMGERYKPLDPKRWRDTVRAAVKAGAKPDGAFSLRNGGRLLATFTIGDEGDGPTRIKSHLNLVDAIDGSMSYVAGASATRVVCENTLAVALAEGGKSWARIRHTASINDRADALREAIEESVKAGTALAETYAAARAMKLQRDEARAVFDALFPAPTPKQIEDKPRTATRLRNLRNDAAAAMKRDENNEGGTLASIWNAATWVVDRHADGTPRNCRGDAVDSMLFGSRGKRVEEVKALVTVLLADGTEALMEAHEASAAGVDDAQIGRSVLAQMLS